MRCDVSFAIHHATEPLKADAGSDKISGRNNSLCLSITGIHDRRYGKPRNVEVKPLPLALGGPRASRPFWSFLCQSRRNRESFGPPEETWREYVEIGAPKVGYSDVKSALVVLSPRLS